MVHIKKGGGSYSGGKVGLRYAAEELDGWCSDVSKNNDCYISTLHYTYQTHCMPFHFFLII